jgi:hypothetical protein
MARTPIQTSGAGRFSYLKVTEETALISNSIRLYLGHLDAVEK